MLFVSVWIFWVLLFLLLLYLLCDHLWVFWVLGSGSLVLSCWVLVLGKLGFLVSLVVISGLCFYLFVLNILSCYQVGLLVRLLLTRC